jgi:hypothetical protein
MFPYGLARHNDERFASAVCALDRISLMSANGTKRTSHLHYRMSAIGGKADMSRTGCYANDPNGHAEIRADLWLRRGPLTFVGQILQSALVVGRGDL